MDKSTVLDIISRFKEAIENQSIKVDKIILYGSWAYGIPHEWSDIDLIVISESFKDKGYWDRIEILSKAIYKVFEPIEALAYTPEEWELGEDGIIDYARQGETVFAA